MGKQGKPIGHWLMHMCA